MLHTYRNWRQFAFATRATRVGKHAVDIRGTPTPPLSTPHDKASSENLKSYSRMEEHRTPQRTNLQLLEHRPPVRHPSRPCVSVQHHDVRSWRAVV